MRLLTLNVTACLTGYTVLTTDSLAVTLMAGITSLGLAIQSVRDLLHP